MARKEAEEQSRKEAEERVQQEAAKRQAEDEERKREEDRSRKVAEEQRRREQEKSRSKARPPTTRYGRKELHVAGGAAARRRNPAPGCGALPHNLQSTDSHVPPSRLPVK